MKPLISDQLLEQRAPSSLTISDQQAARLVREQARPLTGSEEDDDELLKFIGDSSIVMLGESSHGTHEFYRQRACITRRLIEEKGFNAVTVEADWPDAYRVNRFVRGEPGDHDAAQALAGFQRFPSWMWRNADILDFIDWLRDHNDRTGAAAAKAGFYGLDLFSLHKSISEVISYLMRVQPEAAARARLHYGCFDRFGGDVQHYGLLTATGIHRSCRKEVLHELAELRSNEARHLAANGRSAADVYFFAEQNARLVRNAERYYRALFHPKESSWNIRDHHMVETLVELMAHLESRHGDAKVVVWAHNSHLGDARATDLGRRGEVTLGQLVRDAFPGQGKIIGFTSHSGTVTAAVGWHSPPERMELQPARPESYEHLFHQVGIPRFWLDLTSENPAVKALRQPRLQRAVGVVYHPEAELQHHYFKSDLPGQFDAIVHSDLTRAVEPLDPSERWRHGEAPDTFPAGL